MKKGLFKGFSFVLLLFVLLFSHVFFVFAAIPSGMTPYDYLFFMASSACGVSAPGQYIYQLESVFEGYLELTNNTSILNQLKSYKDLSWGDTAENVDNFISVYYDWLSQANINSDVIDLPTSPSSPVVEKKGRQIQFIPFENDLPTNLSDTSVYVISTGFLSNYGTYMGVDYYLVDVGENEIFVVLGSSPFSSDGKISFCFYQSDSSSSSGHKRLDSKGRASQYNLETGDLVKKDAHTTFGGFIFSCDVRTLLNCPFKIFRNTADLEEYLKGGKENTLFKNSFSLINDGTLTFDSDIQNRFLSSNQTLELPSSLDEATTNYTNILNSQTLDERFEQLKETGLNVSYSASYTVEHYKQDINGETFTKEEIENFTSTVGAMANFTFKDYIGFTFAKGLTEPDSLIVSSDGLTIKLYYLRDLISYTVEHYQQDIADESGKQGWTLVDQDLLSGLFETEAAFTPKNYSGFTFAEQLTEPDNYILPADDRTLTVKLYYTRNPVQYIVEHYTQDLIRQDEGSGWTLMDREVLTGVAGIPADYSKKNYPGLLYNPSLTKPTDQRISADGSTVIKCYYTQNLFGEFKEPLDTVTKTVFSAAVLVLPLSFIVLFLIRLFKQILSKA